METTEYKADFFDRVEARAEARGEANALLKILKSRGIGLTEEQRETVASSTDPAQVDRWLDKALTATSADDVFKD